MTRKLNKASKKLFLEIHDEYQFQHSDLRGESNYSYELLQLQHRLLKGEKPEVIKKAFEQLKMKDSVPQVGLSI